MRRRECVCTLECMCTTVYLLSAFHHPPLIITGSPSTAPSDTISAEELYSDADFQSAIDVLVGRRDILEFVGPELYKSKAAQVRKQLLETPGALERLHAVRKFAVGESEGNALPTPPPAPPSDVPVPGIDLDEWKELPEVVEY